MRGNNSGPGIPVRLSITGRQTEPDGTVQEDAQTVLAGCTASGGGWLFSYRTAEGPARLFLSRSLAWTERGTSSRADARMVFDPSVPETTCLYPTPFGEIPMEVRTEGIAVLGGPTGGSGGDAARGAPQADLRLRARIRYTLQLDAGYARTCAVTIRADRIDAIGS